MAGNCCEHCTNAGEDHDIIIRIDENMKTFIRRSNDHESRLRRTERWGFLAIGFIFAVQVIMGVYLTVRSGKP